LPLFLHSRAAHADFVAILRAEGFGTDGGRAEGARGGVAHSFTGTPEEAAELVNMGFHISINGCGLKTEENLQMVKAVPLDRLLLETGRSLRILPSNLANEIPVDAPWCSMTSTHASHVHLQSMPEDLRALFSPLAVKPDKFVAGKPVKGRNEPMSIGGVAWVVAQVKQVLFEEVVEAAWRNTNQLFGFALQ
jgi:TatD DNase family protein